MVFPTTAATPGFQGSDHSYAEVIIYQHGDDPVVLSAVPFIGYNMDGQKSSDKTPSITSVMTQKELGAASGNFQVTVKPSRESEILFDKLNDDDWVDIIFYKGDEGHHVMRGLIDETRRARGVGGKGATTETFTIAGRDFGKIWESTPIWFSPYANDLVTQAASIKLFDGLPTNFHSPGLAPFFYLKEFIEEFTALGGVNWAPPKGMPGVNPLTFTGNIEFGEDLLGFGGGEIGSSMYVQNKPARKVFNANAMNPQGMCWDLAREYSDPAFTELYVDLLPNGDPYSPRLSLGDSISPLETKMSVILRDKPFPVMPDTISQTGFVPQWNLLPTHTVNRQEITTDDIGKSGYERYNSFYVTPRLVQEVVGSFATNMLAPLIDKESVKRHGIRRMDIQSNVTPDLQDFNVFARAQRNFLRDWYCMNSYYLSGTISLAHGRPDIKIGNKLSIPGTILSPTNIEGEETYYIESVINNWQAGTGTRTTAGVTRGWIGTDAEYLAALTKVTARYAEPPLLLEIPGV